MELRPQRERDPAAYRAARLPAGDGGAERAGLRLGADRVPDGGDERRCAPGRARRSAVSPAGGDRRPGARAERSQESGHRHRGGGQKHYGSSIFGCNRRAAGRAGARCVAALLRQFPARPSALRRRGRRGHGGGAARGGPGVSRRGGGAVASAVGASRAAHAGRRPGRGTAALQPALLGVSDRPDRGGRARRFASSARRAAEKSSSFKLPQGVYRALARPA